MIPRTSLLSRLTVAFLAPLLLAAGTQSTEAADASAVRGMSGVATLQDCAPTISWARQFGAVGPARAFLRSAASDGYVYVAGYAVGFLPGQTTAGSVDAIVRKYDSAGSEMWSRQFGSVGSDEAYGIAVDTTGVYVVGRTTGALPGHTSLGSYDAFVRQYDAAGNELWTRQFGSATLDEVYGVSIDATGVYIAGRTFGTLPGQVNVGSSDAFVRKYDALGNELWTRQFGTNSVDIAYGISADSSGVYVAGTTRGSLPGNTSVGSFDVFVRKYDASGTDVWTRQFGTASNDEARAVSAVGGSIFVAGSVAYALPGQSSAGSLDAFVRSFDAAGNEVWTRQFGSAWRDEAFGISTDGIGVYLAGRTAGALPGQSSAGADDSFVRGYDVLGTEQWTRQYGSYTSEQAFGIAVHDVSVYVAGFTPIPTPGQTGVGSDEAHLRKYDLTGNELWSRQFGSRGPSVDLLRAVYADGGVVVAGEVGGTLQGQTDFGGGYDAFVRKYDATGNELWTRQFGTAGNDSATGIVIDTSGVYVAGVVGGALPGQTSDGGDDAYIRKYDTDGNEIWTRQFGAAGYDGVVGISVDTSGIFVVGATDGALPGHTSAGYFDVFVRRYDPDGNEVWTRQFGSETWDMGAGITADSTGIYVAGETNGALPGQTIDGPGDAFVRKYDLGGNEIWTRQFGTAEADAAWAVAAGPDGVYVTGQTWGAFPGQTQASVGWIDVFVRKYDAAGNEIWTRQFGTADAEQAYDIAVSPSGVDVVGMTGGALPGQTSAGGGDAYVRRYDHLGNELWTMQFGSAGDDYAFGVAMDGSSIVLAGWTDSAVFGQESAGSFDVFVAKVDPPNCGPTVDAGGPYSGSEGSLIVLDGASASDAGGGPLSFAWSVDDPVRCAFTDSTIIAPTLTCADDGSYTVTLVVDNGSSSQASSDTVVTVENVAPSVESVAVPADPVSLGSQPLTGVSALYNDSGTADTHTCMVSFGDSSGQHSGTAGDGLCIAPAHTYAGTGVYTVMVTVTDDDGASGSAVATAFLVVYDPTGGFVTGGGWINSPAGAYVADPDLTGRANFGFVAKYKPGATKPDGNTNFQFQAGDLHFQSTSYDWLVVAGQDKAKYKGTGTINGAGAYRFMLTVIDNGNSGDKFHIKIWDDNGVVYDNAASSGDDDYDGTVIGGGNIKVHKQ